MKKLLIEKAREIDTEVTEEQAEIFIKYMDILIDYNKKVNLTAIKDEKGILEKHFIDSMLLLKACEIKQDSKIADVGSGAGFPGVPIKIMRPDLKVTLIESIGKKAVFLKYLTEKLGLDTEVLNRRGEELGREKGFKNSFEFVTARAVAPLGKLCGFCMPLLKPGGTFAAMKAADVKEEIAEASHEIKKYGGELSGIWKGKLPDNAGERSIVIIKKM